MIDAVTQLCDAVLKIESLEQERAYEARAVDEQ
jgi:hypothetical protein